MINFIKTYLWLLIPFLWMSPNKTDQNAFKTIKHNVVVNHPGEEKPVNTILSEIQNANGLPIEYTMDVYSVICLEEVCKVIPVKLFWDNTGKYQKYELAKGETLEKYEADLFEPEDYIKLQNILADNDSPFKEVYIDEILTVPDEHGNEDVDAISGATALELDEKDTVPGAALTCYTLWHWANGDVVSQIKSQTGKSVTETQLKNFILDSDNTYFHIAINELEVRKLYSKPFIDVIIRKLLEDASLLRPAYKYLNHTSNEDYLNASKTLFFQGQKEQKLVVLQSLRQTQQNIPQLYLDNLSSEVTNLNSYQEVSLLLELMQDKNPNSPKVIENTFLLLDVKFLVARRAFWFLKNQKLNDSQQKQLNSFQEKHKNKL
ncbi:hypothetical protein [Flavivirga rizhaonensis]|uniref:Uncharacterized protein n=1 Tax=Flavivirga rizhaonensis TaxID=2559571 RepID=A0A4S1DUW9_9FLAO|nr:hypothetical protein [Flavivirga rizhaonensis]TGV01880.1 hypothetical protein EM932_13685 [Flavivirga rizhaonensis]